MGHTGTIEVSPSLPSKVRETEGKVSTIGSGVASVVVSWEPCVGESLPSLFFDGLDLVAVGVDSDSLGSEVPKSEFTSIFERVGLIPGP